MKRSKRPHEPVTLFIDNNLGSVLIPEALADVDGLTVVCGNIEFPAGTPDVVWIPAIALRGWPVLTADKRIRHRPAEILALAASGLHFFFVSSHNMTGPEQAAMIRGQIDKIRDAIRRYQPPCMFTVSPSRVEPIQHELVPVVRRSAVKRDGEPQA